MEEHWKLRTVLNNGELSTTSTSFGLIQAAGFKVMLETVDVVFLLDPYYNEIRIFYIDKED